MEFIDICAGIGGFRFGLENAGHKCIGFVEKDKYAVKSYRAMYETEGEWYRDDITTIRSDEIPYADCWCFGFPCQDISIAGKQRGLDGKRSGIYFDIIELVKGKKEEDRPEWMLVENVKNLLSIDGGWGFSRVLSELDEAGYDAEWQVLNSKNFGVPQNRERVYIVGHLRARGGRKILPIRGENTGDLKQVGDLGSGGQRGRVYDENGIAPSLTATDYKGVKLVQIIGGSQGERVYDPSGVSVTLSANKGKVKTTENARTIQARYNKGMSTRSGETSGVLEYRYGSAPSTLRVKNATKKGYSEADIGDSVNLAFPESKTRRGRVGKKICQTLDTSCNIGAVTDGPRIRRLTPKECFRLQGFSDELFEKAESVNSESQLYKQAGNAVTVNVVYGIGKIIKASKEIECPIN